MAIKDGLLETMNCPFPGCNVMATQDMVRRLVSFELFERYETLTLKSVTADMPNIVITFQISTRSFIWDVGLDRLM